MRKAAPYFWTSCIPSSGTSSVNFRELLIQTRLISSLHSDPHALCANGHGEDHLNDLYSGIGVPQRWSYVHAASAGSNHQACLRKLRPMYSNKQIDHFSQIVAAVTMLLISAACRVWRFDHLAKDAAFVVCCVSMVCHMLLHIANCRIELTFLAASNHSLSWN